MSALDATATGLPGIAEIQALAAAEMAGVNDADPRTAWPPTWC